MKEIKLSQICKNNGKYVALVDDEDYEALNSFRWCAYKHGNTFYAARSIMSNGKKSTIRMHQMILRGTGIDHIDGNGLNNQKSNLRFCTKSENAMNMRKHKNTTSIYKGVYFNKHAKKWQADITINGKIIYMVRLSIWAPLS